MSGQKAVRLVMQLVMQIQWYKSEIETHVNESQILHCSTTLMVNSQ